MKVLDVAGLSLVTVGCGVAWLPLGLLAAGVGCLWLSWSLARRKATK